MSAAAILLVGYLLLTAPLLPAGGTAPTRLLVLALHLGSAAGLVMLGRTRGRTATALSAWAPLLVAGLLYAELPLLMEGLPGAVGYHDPAVSAVEQALFGTQPAYAWAGAWAWMPLSELLHLCYVSYYPLIYVPPLLVFLGVSGPRDAVARRAVFDETVLALMLSFLACFLVFIALPVQGPRYLGVPAGVPDGPVRGLVLAVLESGSSRGAAFPSSHVAVAVAQASMALRHQPAVGRVVLPLAVGLAAGAVYGGFHYAVDALAGAAVGVLAALVARPLAARLKEPIPGFTSPSDAA